MSLDPRIFDILQRWTTARERGETLTAEQLCADCPELAEEVRGRIKMLEAMNWLENSDGGSDPPPPEAQPRRTRTSTHDLANEPTVGLVPASERKTPEIGSYVRYVGDYELLAEIARGGMGVVFKARQVRLKRVVALKMILAGRMASEQEVRRFHTEAEAAANLEHPHIVPIFEVGEQKGLHYFSMGYVDGQSLAVRLADGPLSAREAAMILRPVAEAVHYAHQKGVIHRDLKPGNILLDKQGQPRVTDFGLAKRVSADASELTGTGQILGTASYMPPEQALGRPGLVRESADIYALGAVLYAMLIGRPPFQADNPVETLRQVMERDPVSPRQLNPAIPVDLETICLKCLEKVASRRYATAQEVADELGRFLDGKPILARPVSSLNRAWRWCQRNRAVAALLAAVAASLVIGIAVSSYFAFEADRRADENFRLAIKNRDLAREEKRARGDAEISRETAEKNERIAKEQTRLTQFEAANLNLNEALGHCERGEPHVGLLWMAAALERAVQAGDMDLADACRDMASLWLPQVPRLTAVYGKTGRTGAAFGANDRTILQVDWAWEFHTNPRATSADINKALAQGLTILDRDTGKILERIPNVRSPMSHPVLSSDRLRILLLDQDNQPRIWSIPEHKWLGDPLKVDGPIWHAKFSGDGWRLCTMTRSGKYEFWNAHDGKSTGVTLQTDQHRNHEFKGTLTFTPAGQIIVTSDGWGAMRICDSNNFQDVWKKKEPIGGRAILMDTHPNGAQIVTLRTQPSRLVAHWMNGEMSIAAETPTEARVHAIRYSPDGRWIAEGGDANQLIIRDASTLKPACGPALHQAGLWSVDFDGTSREILVAGLNSCTECWELPAKLTHRKRDANIPGDATTFVIRNDAGAIETVVTIGKNGYQRLRRPTPDDMQKDYPAIPARPMFATVSMALNSLVGVTEDGKAFRTDLSTGKTVFSDSGHPMPVKAYYMSPTCDVFGTACSQEFRLWSTRDASAIGAPIKVDVNKPMVHFTADGGLMSLCSIDDPERLCRLVDTRSGNEVQPPIKIPGQRPNSVAIDPTGTKLVVVRGRTLELWDRASVRLIRQFGSHDNNIARVGFSQDGSLIYSVGQDRVIRVWSTKSGERVGRPMRGVDSRGDIVIRPDGQWIGTLARGETLQHWHVASGRRLGSPNMGLVVDANTLIWGYAFRDNFGYSPDSREFVYFDPENTYPLLDVPTTPEIFRLFVESWTGMALEGNDVRVLPRDEWELRRRRLRELVSKTDESGVKLLVGETFDPNRDMARWVLGGHGELRITNVDGNRAITRLQDLPEKAFDITAITLNDKRPFDADQIPNLQWPIRLEMLRVRGSSFNDHMLLRMRNLPSLRRVYLTNTAATDKGLARLADFPTIEHLEVDGAQHTAQWLRGVAAHGKLKALAIRGPLVGDQGCEAVKNCPDLLILALGDQLTDESCSPIAELPNLRTLTLKGAITLDGVKKLAGCKRLSFLGLSAQTPIDAETLKAIATAWPNLHTLALGDIDEAAETMPHLSKFDRARLITLGRGPTKEMLTQLSESLPGCHIVSVEHGKFGPESPADPERASAAWALKDNGEIEALIGDSYQSGKSATVSSKGLVRVHAVKLSASAAVNDVSQLSLCDRLYSLEAPAMTDAAGPSLTALTSLERLVLNKSKVSNAILEHLAKLPQLTELNLADCKVSDEGLKRLAGCKTLKTLDLRRTNATNAGVEALQAQLPDCSIMFDKP
jgi:eukaryotic-like serine/threonine-protein kinase